jgi:hypothetical protein
MVNNAGTYRGAALTETDTDAFDQVIAIDVRGVFAGCRAAALELARHDIRVNAVAPGIVRTTFGQGNPDYDRDLGDGFLLSDADLPDLRDQDLEPTIPMARTATPDGVAGAYLYCVRRHRHRSSRLPYSCENWRADTYRCRCGERRTGESTSRSGPVGFGVVRAAVGADHLPEGRVDVALDRLRLDLAVQVFGNLDLGHHPILHGRY